MTLLGLRKRHHSGITMETAHEEVSTLLRAEFYLRDPDMRRWKSEELIREATSAGLLLRSRELQEAGFDVADYLAIPSFDYGPLVPLAGPLVCGLAQPTGAGRQWLWPLEGQGPVRNRRAADGA